MVTLPAQIGHGIALAGLDLLTAPWWWYTHGLMGVLRWAGRTIRGWEHVVGIRFWARSIFVPMFGQTDWQGRLISVAMRFVILIGRTIQVLAGVLVVALAVAAYVVAPVVALWLLVAPQVL